MTRNKVSNIVFFKLISVLFVLKKFKDNLVNLTVI